MKEARYELTKCVERKELHIRHNDKKINFHHIIHRQDYADNLVPRNFPLHGESNVIPLPIHIHEQLHWIDDQYFHQDISTRVYLANMAFNSELDLVPDRMFFTYPNLKTRYID